MDSRVPSIYQILSYVSVVYITYCRYILTHVSPVYIIYCLYILTHVYIISLSLYSHVYMTASPQIQIDVYAYVVHSHNTFSVIYNYSTPDTHKCICIYQRFSKFSLLQNFLWKLTIELTFQNVFHQHIRRRLCQSTVIWASGERLLHYIVLQCVAVRCSVLQCVAVRCNMLQCVTDAIGRYGLQVRVCCAAVRCSAMQ